MKRVLLLICFVGCAASADWKWYQWPPKELVFHGLGIYGERYPGRWVCKTPNVSITYSEEQTISVLITLPRVTHTADDQLKRIDEDCTTLLTNLFPYWDGAYQSIVQLWTHYESDKKMLPVHFNQFTIKYTSNQAQRTLTIEPRKEFSFKKRYLEFMARKKY